MSDQHDVQQFVDQTHIWAMRLLDRGACPSCLAQAMIAEGFVLAGEVGALALAKEIAERYADGNGGSVLRKH